jgi:hypothetical protein
MAGHRKCDNRAELPRSAPVCMERAARLIKNNKYASRIVGDEDLARGLWRSTVGKTIARHTGRITLVRSTLVVEVEDATWQRQLHSLSLQIVNRLQRLMGSTVVSDIEFRIGVPRREPQRAESPRHGLFGGPQESIGVPADEAECIQDPVLKKIYRISRKRATA